MRVNIKIMLSKTLRVTITLSTNIIGSVRLHCRVRVFVKIEGFKFL